MSPHSFVTGLAKASPSEVELMNVGLSSQDAAEFRKSYQCPQRHISLKLCVPRNEITTLLTDWDLTHAEIGLVRFAEPPKSTKLGVQIGVVESDRLVLAADSNEVVVYEAGTSQHILWKVAKSPDVCLDALLICALFLSKRSVGKIKFEDFVAARSAAISCSLAAGGNEYGDFYVVLLGANP